jgi:hypothetical protein
MSNHHHRKTRSQTQVARPLRHLLDRVQHIPIPSMDQVLLIVSFVLIIRAGNVADYLMGLTAVNAWEISINIYRSAFLLLIYALRKEIMLLTGPIVFRLMYYLLINHFVDLYLGYRVWSINDTLTVLLVVGESVVLLLSKTAVPQRLNQILKLFKK